MIFPSLLVISSISQKLLDKSASNTPVLEDAQPKPVTDPLSSGAGAGIIEAGDGPAIIAAPSIEVNTALTPEPQVKDQAGTPQQEVLTEGIETAGPAPESEALGDGKSDIAAAYAKKLDDTAIQLAAREEKIIDLTRRLDSLEETASILRNQVITECDLLFLFSPLVE